jgi:hypothetical protein
VILAAAESQTSCEPIWQYAACWIDGKPKVFRDSAVENLQAFFQRFRSLNVGSSQQLDELVPQAQRFVSGVDAQPRGRFLQGK